MDFINNSITSSNDNVNTTKYSMQENENNSQKTKEHLEIKYSQSTKGAWNKFLKSNSINKGTGETMQDVKLAPQNNNIALSHANNEQTLYNSNGSESSINENSRRIKQYDKRRVQKLFEIYEGRQRDGSSSSQELRSNQEQQDISVNKNTYSKENLILSKENYRKPAKEGTIRLYTNTKSTNIEAILNKGLRIDKSKQKEYEGNMTWFETTPDLKGYGGTTIAVDIPVNASMDKVNNTQYTVYDNISPENIVFVDKPIFNNYRTSDLQELVSNFGKEKVLEVFN